MSKYLLHEISERPLNSFEKSGKAHIYILCIYIFITKVFVHCPKVLSCWGKFEFLLHTERHCHFGTCLIWKGKKNPPYNSFQELSQKKFSGKVFCLGENTETPHMAQPQHTLHTEHTVVAVQHWRVLMGTQSPEGFNPNEMVHDGKWPKGIACIPCSLGKDLFLTCFTSHIQDLFLSANASWGCWAGPCSGSSKPQQWG